MWWGLVLESTGDIAPVEGSHETSHFIVISTGRVRFEDHIFSDHDVVLSGGRPKLPEDLDPSIKDINTTAWHLKLSKRPDFRFLEKRLCVLHSQREPAEWVNAQVWRP